MPYLRWRKSLPGSPSAGTWRHSYWEGHAACRLLFDDYPFAADGILLWKAIYGWAERYVRVYYKGPGDLAGDAELQAWWADVREGHTDKAEGWPEPKSTEVGMGSAADVLGTGCVTRCMRDVHAQLLHGRPARCVMLDKGLGKRVATPLMVMRWLAVVACCFRRAG